MNKIPENAKLPRNQMRRRLAPGIWEDMEGNVHWSVTELLEFIEMEDTPANRTAVTEILNKIVRENVPKATIINREKPD